ncbi:hypothetical protein COCC4DRAFT_56727 [Bipolaris maydis ATCC 48331]|uniref:Uncharacterized protein n=1 Tax=Cochliobolus heterostrophus (strain C4 / ATCC 48331 / race T) TaxID=665024 RepID=N4XC15_COCH4|nr:uncharacterized protein COCC4DRAFT_56727 [Bipolaris maydis ATCC 48331]ENI09205.1 hypothetical protein COCC4DRAFT_56727 [Bipolaris maydis ATCC 48331]
MASTGATVGGGVHWGAQGEMCATRDEPNDDGGGGDGNDEETDEEATRQCRWTDELQKKRHAICHRGTRERNWADWREIGLGCLRNNERVAEESLIFAVRVDGPCSSCSGDGGPGGQDGHSSSSSSSMGAAGVQSWTCSRKTREAGAAIDFGCGAQQRRPSVADSRPRPRARSSCVTAAGSARVECICIALTLGRQKK